jgi:hypothetical protein
MLIGNTTYYVLLGLGVVMVVGGIGAIKLAQMTWTAHRGRYAAAIGAVIVGGIGGLYLFFKSTEVAEVHQRDGRVEVDKLHLIGSATVELDGRPVEITGMDDHSWVINRSDVNVQVESFVYSETSFPNYSEPEVIAPHTVKQVSAEQFDHIGPGDRPPSSISSKSGFEVRYWLTW